MSVGADVFGIRRLSGCSWGRLRLGRSGVDIVDVTPGVHLCGLVVAKTPRTVDDEFVLDFLVPRNFDGGLESSRGLGEVKRMCPLLSYERKMSCVSE